MLNRKLILALLLGLAALSSGCVLSGCAGSIIETDNVQERLDTAAPVIAGSRTVGQSFVSHYARLSAVELLLVVYPDDGLPADTLRNLTFHLRPDPQDQTDIVTLAVDTSNLKHNDPCQFSFPPQTDSENKTYYFFLDATEGNRTTVWHSSFDAYGEGTYAQVALKFTLILTPITASIIAVSANKLYRGGGWLAMRAGAEEIQKEIRRLEKALKDETGER